MRQLSRHLTQPLAQPSTRLSESHLTWRSPEHLASPAAPRLARPSTARPSTARRSLRHALTIATIVLLGGAACSKDGASQLRDLRDEACACKTRQCAAAVGGKLAKLAVDSELDEARAKLAIEATTCLAAHGE